ncbi:TonB-dependent receptor [Sphingomonas sp. CGMCC 1.13654]|uniref:TonB-dependent receptor n=1 Tax=Sphingomonas chungangi TaxID=2683589 RepID=A0A838L6V1_9SPHN|nr:TonB-dependent receptor [Sphingomonas chungangi]MBA2934219.1 TonB-dependent receptor [Sphingomonas chungangi]MVW57260.1 TonB-dependent receptor plug domain-containing protein [Sphingomonas chungangi]
MFDRRPIPALLLATTAIAGLSMPALAADAAASPAASPPDNGEIIVTAQKRSENIQRVPISIQAITSEKLDQLNIANFNDYTKQLPSVSYQEIQPGETSVYIRGVVSGGDGNHSGSLPSVGTYLDEQPITTIGGTLDIHVYDIARIEELSGPQGTLYGASSESGTIRIITNKPDTSHFYGAMDVEGNTVAHGSQGGKAEGFVNIPVDDRIAVRLVGFYEHDAGYIDNVHGTRTFIGARDPASPGYTGGVAPGGVDKGVPAGFDPGITIDNKDLVKKNYNDVDTFGGRGALKVELNDNWTANATVFGQDQKNHGSFGYDPNLPGLSVQHFLPEYNHDRYIQGALTIEGKIGSWDLTYAGSYLWRKINSSSDYTDYSTQYDHVLYSAPQYGGLANYFAFQDDAGNTINPIQKIVGRDTFNKLSQELRISSPQENRLRVTAGGFYQRQFHHIVQDYQVAGLGSDVSVNGHPGTLWLTDQNRIDKDYAAFGEASFDILHNLTLTGGLRYYKYDNSLIGFFGFGLNPNYTIGGGAPPNAAESSRTGVPGCYTTDGGTVIERNADGDQISVNRDFAPAAQGLGPCTNLGVYNSDGSISPKRTKGDGIIHRLNLTWKITPDKMIYATWSRGFRPGGINRRAELDPYEPDFLTNYEIGWKTSWADHKVRWNGAFFWEDWKHFQYSFLGQNSFTEIHNGPNARIKGVETDITLIPTPGFTIFTTAAYTDGKLRANLCAIDDPTFTCADTGNGNSVVAPKGTRLPVAPEYKIANTTRYEFRVGDDVKAHVQGALTFQSKASSALRLGAVDDPVPTLKSYVTIDGAVGADWKNVSAELFATNIFDVKADVSTFQECGSCSLTNYYVILPPRTIGIRAGYKF